MRLRMLVIIGILVLGSMLAAIPAGAMTGGAVLGYDAGCEAFTVTYGEIDFDRNNSGTGIELYHLFVTDGDGHTIYSLGSGYPVGLSIPSQTEGFPYASAPTRNPIHLVFFSDAGNGFSKQVIWDLEGECPDLPSSGPSVTSGFVLHTIICDVPVYDAPAGSPVGDNRITAGQTWFVNATPVTGADGAAWTEIYVSGYQNGFIPSSCVG